MIDICSAYYGITKKAALIKGDFLQYFEERCMLKNNTYHSVFKQFFSSATDTARLNNCL